jgi:hypothetical protein
MGIRTGIATVLASGLVIGLAVTAPAGASQAAKWNPAPPSTLQSVVKSINAQAKADGKKRYSPGCYQALVWPGKGSYAVINVRAGKNVEACGDPVKFGIRAYRKSGSKWIFVGGPAGGPGTACEYEKTATAADKSFMRKTKMCR